MSGTAVEYPRTMTRDGKERPVGDAAEEAEKAAEGWVVVSSESLVSSDYDTKPTFGDAGDDSYTKRRKK